MVSVICVHIKLGRSVTLLPVSHVSLAVGFEPMPLFLMSPTYDTYTIRLNLTQMDHNMHILI